MHTTDLKHAKLSASGSHRWMGCPGSVAAEAAFPEQTSVYALEGSAAHWVAEQCLVNNEKAEHYVGCVYEEEIDGEIHTFEVDWDMAEHVQVFIDYVQGIVEATGGQLMVEKRVDFSRWVPEGFGTSDVIIITEDIIFVIDLKFGKGVSVDATDNPQLKLYGLGAMSELDALLTGSEIFTLVVHQPRLNHVSEWSITFDDLLDWGDKVVVPAAELALSEGAERIPSEKACRFCKAQGTCRALTEATVATATEGFGEITEDALVDYQDLTPEEVGKLLEALPTFKAWMNALEAFAKTAIERGEEIPGWKLVAGRGSRSWNDEEAAEKALKRKVGAANAYEKKLLSPAKAEKLIGKNDHIMQKYVDMKPGAPTLAPESDKRPAINVMAQITEGFENEAA